MKLAKRERRIGPRDHGRRMSLDRYNDVQVVEGYRYELAGGVIQVSEFPVVNHVMMLAEARNQLVKWHLANPSRKFLLAGAAESKLLIQPTQSERHPDIAIYLTSPPNQDDDVWSIWIPEIVVEIVSLATVNTDYLEKPTEYWKAGVYEYWIIDPLAAQMTVLCRWRAQWKKEIVKPRKKYATPHLPGFTLDLKRVLAAGK